MRYLLIGVLLAACSPMNYVRGVPNLAQVEPSVWRSGQISSQEGWDFINQIAAGRHLHVVKLNFPNEGTDDLAIKMGIDVHELPIQPQGDQDVFDDARGIVSRPDEQRVAAAEAVIAQCAANPSTDACLVHCTHGQDRTGYVIGRWRVDHDRWTKDRAFAEMISHHFHWELVGLMVAWEAFTAR